MFIYGLASSIVYTIRAPISNLALGPQNLRTDPVDMEASKKTAGTKLSKQRNKIEQPLQLKVSGRGDLARSIRLQAATDSTPCPSYSSLPIASCAAGASPCSAMEAVSNEINLYASCRNSSLRKQRRRQLC